MKKFQSLVMMSLFVVSLIPNGMAANLEVGVNNASTPSKDTLSNTRERGFEKGEIQLELEEKTAAIVEHRQERLDQWKELRAVQVDAMKAKHPEIAKKLREQLNSLSAKKLENLEKADPLVMEKLIPLNETEIREFAKLDAKTLSRLRKIDSKQVQALAKLSRADIELYLANASPTENPEQTLNKRRELYKNALRERIIFREQELKAKKQLEAAKERYFETRHEVRDKREDFNKIRAQLKDCRSQRTHGCQDLEALADTAAKEYLNSTIEQIRLALGKSREKVKLSTTMSEETVVRISTEIDSKITSLDALKSELWAAETKSEIKNIASNVQLIWKDSLPLIKVAVEHLVSTKVGVVIARSAAVEDRLKRVLTTLEENGESVGNLDANVTVFSYHIAEARSNWEEAQNTLAGGQRDPQTMQKVHEYLRVSHEHVKEAHQTLNTIVSMIKRTKGGAKILAQTSLQSEMAMGEN